MKIDEDRLLVESKNYFNEYMNSKLVSRKYYYWEVDYFNRIDDINFKQYHLSYKIKEFINEIGKSIFNDTDINFTIEEDSIRNSINIKNVRKIVSSYKIHKEYLSEYILLQILIYLKKYIQNKAGEIDYNPDLDGDILASLVNELLDFLHSDDITNINETIKLQEINFIYSYLNFAIENKYIYLVPNFISYSKTFNGKKLINYFNLHIKEKQENDLFDKESNLKINRINNLFVSKKYENKLSFVFTLSNLPNRDELRYALEVLGGSHHLHFRGQADSNWLLDSSVTRDSSLLDNEHNLFLDILALKPNEFLNDNTEYEKLITMQHYGLPTRLLDVTRNPLISIFFACNNLERKNQDGMVYIFKNKDFLNPDDDKVVELTKIVKKDYKIIKHKTNFEELELLEKNYFIRGVAKNQRINNQSGDFIFVGLGKDKKNNDDVESLVDGYLIIDYEVKKILLENLETMNIHGGSVYPELGNMSSYLINKYK